ncbi:MAG: hypothetical protein DPW09_23980 [Anaerolineae bacterium]|nr:BMP family protein [Anaerolineales bacterium]MCQ3976503.1 hypothetical protein [Anaerolineae bacterium]
MSFKNKRFLFWLLSSLLAIALIAAQCGGAATPAPTEEAAQPTEEAAAPTEAAAEPTEAAAEPTEAAAAAPTEEAAGEEASAAEGDFSGLKVAMLTSGPINDEGWNQTAYEGLKAVEAAGAEIANTENVAQADQLDLIRSYADQGFNIIIGHGFEYGDALVAAAEEYPEVSFIQIGGIAENGKNLVSYVFRPGEGGYAAGILAGYMSPTGKIGGVGAVEIPTIAADFNAFTQAAKTVNPEIGEVPVAYTGSWVDIPKAKEAAIAQIDSGVDLILANGDNANVGAIEAAKENGKVYAIGWTRDQSHLAPELVLTSLEQRVDNILIEAITEIKAGTIEWTNHLVGFAEKASTFAPFNKAVPEEAVNEVNAVIEALVSGQIQLDDNGNVIKDDYHTGETSAAESEEGAMAADADFSNLKVAMLTSGPINDEGWNQTAYEGLKAVEAAGAEIANTENVAQADQLDLIRSYADQGFNVIIGHGFEFGDALTAAAEEYPEVSFIQIGGIAENGKNLVSYVFRAGEAGYAAGILAGYMSPTGKIGGVGAVEIPTIAADFNAFKQAAQVVNPEITDVPVAYTGSWVDIPKAKEAAIAQIDSGVDLIMANGDNANVGAIEAAKENGKVYAIGWTRDQSHLAPELVLTSVEQRVDNILIEAMKEIGAGSIEWKNHVVGFAEQAQTLAPFNKVVPEEAANEVNAVVEALATGKIVLDDEGNVVTDDYHK